VRTQTQQERLMRAYCPRPFEQGWEPGEPMEQVSVGLAVIAKNEEKNLPNLLGSIDGAFDRVVLLDTGSTDNTIDVFASWAKDQTGLSYAVAAWEWTDDFADARNAADRLLLHGTTAELNFDRSEPLVDWRSWADCDDIIVGARNLRQVAQNADPRVTAFFAGYNYAQDPASGKAVVYLSRERLVRTTYTHPWIGAVHEATPIIDGAVTQIPNDVVEWVHRKQMDQDAHVSNERNLKILHAWNEREPGNPRVVGYLGTEHAVRGELDQAIMYFYQYLNQCESGWDQERVQIRRKLAVALMMQDKYDDAIRIAFDGIADVPSWPDSYLTLAEAFLLGKEEPAKAEHWAKRVIDMGAPETMLIVNPMDYEYQPYKLLAMALGNMGRIDEAVEVGQSALMHAPTDNALASAVHGWRETAKRERTADTYVLASEQLVGHDEQAKALALLENCVPHFAYEHPKVVAERSRVRERLLWANNPSAYADHYEYGGSKPEDFIPDDQIDALCEHLPRTNFLLAGIKEQINGA
jgi:glycosyltransferase involved in cell wall biosynthesis